MSVIFETFNTNLDAVVTTFNESAADHFNAIDNTLASRETNPHHRELAYAFVNGGVMIAFAQQLVQCAYHCGLIDDMTLLNAYKQNGHVIVPNQSAIELRDADAPDRSYSDIIQVTLHAAKAYVSTVDDVIGYDDVSAATLTASLDAMDILLTDFQASHPDLTKRFELAAGYNVARIVQCHLETTDDPMQYLIALEQHGMIDEYFQQNEFLAAENGITIPDDRISREVADWALGRWQGPVTQSARFKAYGLNRDM